MRHIYGIIVAKEKAKLAKEDKVYNSIYDSLIIFIHYLLHLIKFIFPVLSKFAPGGCLLSLFG